LKQSWAAKQFIVHIEKFVKGELFTDTQDSPGKQGGWPLPQTLPGALKFEQGGGVGAGVGAGVGEGVGAGVGEGVGAGVGEGVGAGVGRHWTGICILSTCKDTHWKVLLNSQNAHKVFVQ
jgi:hypothetical protein